MTYHQSLKCSAIFTVILFLSGLLLTACDSGAQAKETFTVGAVNFTPALDPAWEGVKAGLAEFDYVEGENITYVYSGPTGSIDTLGPEAQKMVEEEVDLIVSLSTPATLAAQQATADTDIPVIFLPLSDPVGAGIVQSIREPGGNATGIAIGAADGRRLELLLEMVPTVEQVYVPYNSEDQAATLGLERIKEAAATLGIELVPRAARNDEEVTAALEEIPEDVDAVFILTDSLLVARMEDLVATTIEHDLPLTTPSEEHIEMGALMSYSIKLFDIGKHTARLVDQVLQGVDPAGLPVETPDFVLSVNMQTAEAIGLEVPDTILRQAEVIVR